jgi:hypothetical protein
MTPNFQHETKAMKMVNSNILWGMYTTWENKLHMKSKHFTHNLLALDMSEIQI